jgi:hypothetical protein
MIPKLFAANGHSHPKDHCHHETFCSQHCQELAEVYLKTCHHSQDVSELYEMNCLLQYKPAQQDCWRSRTLTVNVSKKSGKTGRKLLLKLKREVSHKIHFFGTKDFSVPTPKSISATASTTEILKKKKCSQPLLKGVSKCNCPRQCREWRKKVFHHVRYRRHIGRLWLLPGAALPE